MRLRFFADHCVPSSVISALRTLGYEVFILKDHLPVDSKDEVVIETALEMQCVLLSLNGDFANIVSYPPGKYMGIVALQVRNRPEVLSQIQNNLRIYLSKCSGMGDLKGKLVIIDSYRTRIRA